MLGIEHRRNGRFDELLNVPYDNRYMVAKVGIHMYSVLDTYRYFASPRGITTADKNTLPTGQRTVLPPKPLAHTLVPLKAKTLSLC